MGNFRTKGRLNKHFFLLKTYSLKIGHDRNSFSFRTVRESCEAPKKRSRLIKKEEGEKVRI